MTTFTPINLSQLPAPSVIETLSFERILTEMKADLQSRAPELTRALDFSSEPVIKLLEVCAYRELLVRQRINHAARATMLAYAQGSNLDHLAALFGVKREVVNQTDEDDERLRHRVQLSLEGHSTAGPIGSYVFHALSASPWVKDVSVSSPAPSQVVVTVLAQALENSDEAISEAISEAIIEKNGTPNAALLNIVNQRLNNENIRPLTDQVLVQAATVKTYQVKARLTLYRGPDASVVQSNAIEAVNQYVTAHHRLGHDITLSGLFAALHQPGVQNVQLEQPTQNIINAFNEAAFCSAIDIVLSGTDE